MKTLDYFTYADRSSRDFGVYINEAQGFDVPSVNQSVITIPGRNGKLIIPENTYDDVSVRYVCQIMKGFERQYFGLINWIVSNPGHQIMMDTIHPDVFRRVYYSGGTQPEMHTMYNAGRFTLEFMADPRRFLREGQTNRKYTSAGEINNPTLMTALPLIRVYGTGIFTIGGCSIQITESLGYTDIDCEIQEAYSGDQNRNGYIVKLSGDFPELRPGKTGITMSSGITRIIITPRWWML